MPKKAKIVRFARSALVLKVTLQEVRPPIWRRLRVAGDLTLRELHHVLQIAMGWTDSHLHEFEIDDRRYGMPDAEEDLGKLALDELDHPLYRLLREGVRAEYVYDFCDGWRHEILVEDAVTPDAGAVKVECLAGARACPPEDCGGDHGYAEPLEAIADPSSELHEELREWVGPDFDPEAFDLPAVNRALRGAGSVTWRRKRERFYG